MMQGGGMEPSPLYYYEQQNAPVVGSELPATTSAPATQGNYPALQSVPTASPELKAGFNDAKTSAKAFQNSYEADPTLGAGQYEPVAPAAQPLQQPAEQAAPASATPSAMLPAPVTPSSEPVIKTDTTPSGKPVDILSSITQAGSTPAVPPPAPAMAPQSMNAPVGGSDTMMREMTLDQVVAAPPPAPLSPASFTSQPIPASVVATIPSATAPAPEPTFSAPVPLEPSPLAAAPQSGPHINAAPAPAYTPAQTSVTVPQYPPVAAVSQSEMLHTRSEPIQLNAPDAVAGGRTIPQSRYTRLRQGYSSHRSQQQ
jgi:hypothetical protein